MRTARPDAPEPADPLAPLLGPLRARRALRAGYESCKRVTYHHAKSFSLASVVLEPERRRGAFAVYAFCRRIDDAVDEADQRDEAGLRARVAALRASLDEVYSHAPLRDEQLLALRDTARRFGLERRPFDELIEGVAGDVGRVRLADDAALDRYCYLVAGTVGLLMARLFGARSERALPHAINLGKAMQLTNILRDVREDLLERDRIYLPQTSLEAYGVDEAALRASAASPALRALVAALAARAEELYRDAALGVPQLASPGGRAATEIMASVYGEILGELAQRGWDVLAGRAVVPTRRKLVRAAEAAARSLRADVQRRTGR